MRGEQNKAKELNLPSTADSARLSVKQAARKREWKERLEKRMLPACPLDKCCPEENSEVWEHSGFHRACQTAVNSCLKARLAGLHIMYQSSQTEHSSFTSLFHMLVLTSAKQGHSAKADFFCPAWKLAPLHCVQASFLVPR